MKMKALISAGGRGTRMRPVTFSTNKHFIPLANKPLLFYAIETVAGAGIDDIGINYNPGQLEEMKAILGTGKKWGVRFTYILQEKPLGLAHIIKVSQNFLGKSPFLLHLGDNIFYGGIKPLVDYFLQEKPNGLVTILRHPESWRLGVPYFDKQGRLIKYVEKPPNPPHDFAIPGLYFFDSHVFTCFKGKEKIIPSARGELEISAPYQWLIDHGYRVETKEFTGVWKDPGKFDDWLDTNRFLLDMDLKAPEKKPASKSVKLEGRVKVGRLCRLKNVLIRGPVVIGDRVKIKDAFIGPFSSISDDCQINDARIENTILMSGVKISGLTKPLESSLIGKESMITGNHHLAGATEVFVGNKCILKL
ncbi:glucose-1-phosphate thymidylyltransferase [Patescibacteria group bacterium]